MDVLKSGGLSTACAETIINAGYDCQAGFAEAFVDSAALERFIKHLPLTLKPAGEVAADMWDIHPVAGTLRALWRSFRPSLLQPCRSISCRPYRARQTAPTRNGCRGSVCCRRMPCLRCADAGPKRRQGASVIWSMRWKTWPGFFMDLELGASAIRVQNLLETRAHAYAMCKAGHLGHWNVYIKKFLAYYSKRTSDGFRNPTVQEAEAADRVAMEEVFGLCFQGHSLDNALNHVCVDRDLLRNLLVEKPKLPKSERPPLKRPQLPPPPPPLDGARRERTEKLSKKRRTGE